MTENNEAEKVKTIERPFLLSILCVSVFVYSTVFSIIFFLGIFFNGWVTKVVNDFMSSTNYSTTEVMLFSGIGFLLYLLSFFGVLLIWRLRRIGLILYILSASLIAGLPILIGFGSYVNLLIMSCLVLFFLAFIRKINQ